MVPKRNYSALDMPSHLKLKERQDGQGAKGEQVIQDFREELRRKERELEMKKRGIQLEDDEAIVEETPKEIFD